MVGESFLFFFLNFNAMNLIYETKFLFWFLLLVNLFYSETTEILPLKGEFTNQSIT